MCDMIVRELRIIPLDTARCFKKGSWIGQFVPCERLATGPAQNHSVRWVDHDPPAINQNLCDNVLCHLVGIEKQQASCCQPEISVTVNCYPALPSRHLEHVAAVPRVAALFVLPPCAVSSRLAMSDPASHSPAFARFLQVVFLVWLVLINLIYYAQFRALVLARFGSLVRH